MIAANTDGITFCIHKEDEKRMYEICNEWEQKVKLSLEYSLYSAYFAADVNSYIAVYSNEHG